MQDWLRRMRLREELLSGTEKAPTPKAERNPATEKQIGAILLPQNLHLAPVVRNHETPPVEQTSSDSQKKTEGGQTRTERIAEQLGRSRDGYQKYRHPVEYAKTKTKDKLREVATEKLQQRLGEERFAKLQKYAAAYQKYRHPVRHVKRKAKQLVKKQVERVLLRSPWFWGLVGIMLVSFFLVMLIATIWDSASLYDKGKMIGKAGSCATFNVGCNSLWNDTFSEGTMRNMLGALSPGSAEGAVPPSRSGRSAGGNTPASAQSQTEASIRAYLAQHNISVRSSGNCSDPNNPSCTSVASLPYSALNSLVNIREACGASCEITITGGTETGHLSHGAERPVVDLAFNQTTAEFLYSHRAEYGITRICTTPDAASARFRLNCSTDEEASHLHVEF